MIILAVLILVLIIVVIYFIWNAPVSPQVIVNSSGKITKATKLRHFARVTCQAKNHPLTKKVEKQTDSSKQVRKPIETDPYTPQQLGSIYLGNTAFAGDGKKIGIITCFLYPRLQQDFNSFTSQYGLKSKTLKIHAPAGTSNDNGWAVETCLDTQWSHVFAPNAETHVFCAFDDSIASLVTAINSAISLKMDVISMSLGTDEAQSVINQLEPLFRAHPEILFLGASGDADIVSYPSSSPNVISVGGTNLTLASDGAFFTRKNTSAITKGAYLKLAETNWYSPDGSGSGHGLSSIFTKPTYQLSHNPSDFRSTPDLSLISASPSDNGVSIYCFVAGGFIGVEGTSVGTPCLAGMLGTALSKRRTALTQATIMTYFYSNVSSSLALDTLLEGAGYVSSRTIDSLVAL